MAVLSWVFPDGHMDRHDVEKGQSQLSIYSWSQSYTAGRRNFYEGSPPTCHLHKTSGGSGTRGIASGIFQHNLDSSTLRRNH